MNSSSDIGAPKTANTDKEINAFAETLPNDVVNFIFSFFKLKDFRLTSNVNRYFYQISQQYLNEMKRTGQVYYGICYFSNYERIHIGDKTINPFITLFGDGNQLSYRSEIPAAEIYQIFRIGRDAKRNYPIALFASEKDALNYLKIDQQIQKDEDDTIMLGRKNNDKTVYTRPIFKVIYPGDKNSLELENKSTKKLENADAAIACLDRRLVIPLEGFVKFPLPEEGKSKTLGQASFVKPSVEFKKTK